jgi:AAA+ ATPase superfamily predicted ATPase
VEQKKGNILAPPTEDPIETATKKVKQTLRDAEKKTVLFNLNLGKNQVMNKETLSKKVTESLCSTVKAGNHDFDIADAEEVLDDILSCSKLEFLGTTSKLYFNNRNPNDPMNNNMYTLPVRMDFKDRYQV